MFKDFFDGGEVGVWGGSHLKFWGGERITAAIFDPLAEKLSLLSLSKFLSPSLSNNHSGFMCHVTSSFACKTFHWWHRSFFFDKFYLFKMSKGFFDGGGGGWVGGLHLYTLISSHLKSLTWRKCYMAAIFESLLTKLKPTTYQSRHLSRWLSQSWDWDHWRHQKGPSPWAQVQCYWNSWKNTLLWVWELRLYSTAILRPFLA